MFNLANNVLSVDEIRKFLEFGCSTERCLESVISASDINSNIAIWLSNRLDKYYSFLDCEYSDFLSGTGEFTEASLVSILSEADDIRYFDSVFNKVKAFDAYIHGFDYPVDCSLENAKKLRDNLRRALLSFNDEIPSAGIKVDFSLDDVELFLSLDCDYAKYFYTKASQLSADQFDQWRMYQMCAWNVEDGNLLDRISEDIKRIGEYDDSESVLFTADRVGVLYDILHPSCVGVSKDMNYLRNLTKIAKKNNINKERGIEFRHPYRNSIHDNDRFITVSGNPFNKAKVNPSTFDTLDFQYDSAGMVTSTTDDVEVSKPSVSRNTDVPKFVELDESKKCEIDTSRLTTSKNDDGTFVVISDFHNCSWPIDKIKDYYVNEYDKIYILGDATDRGIDGTGSSSIAMIRTIKALCDQYHDKVVYLAGNHDDFLYKYMDYGDSPQKRNARADLLANNQTGTISEVDELRNRDSIKFAEIRDWLGSCKLQAVHRHAGKTYYLAHAIFNKAAYDSNPNLCLKDNYFEYHKGSSLERQMFSILWYRQDREGLNKVVPSELIAGGPNNIMVTGHTPYIDGYTVVGSNGEEASAYVVDSGVSHNSGYMKKFTANGLEDTVVQIHSPSKNN